MASEPTLKDLLAGVPDSALSQRLQDGHKLAEIAREIVDWKELVDDFGLTEVDQANIEGNNRRVENQKIAFLRTWIGRFSIYATYGNLAEAFYKAKKPKMIEKIRTVLGYPMSVTTTMTGSDRDARTTGASATGGLSGKPELADALRVLFPVAKRWKNIGTFLKVPAHKLDNIEMSNREPDDCLREMLSVWLTQVDPPPTWKALADAVKIINPTVAQEIEQMILSQPVDNGANVNSEVIRKTDKPKFRQLLEFTGRRETINIVERIGTNYSSFGTFLLEDDNGVKVPAIVLAQRGDPIAITEEILRGWLDGKGSTPITWGKLVECLRSARLNELARQIKEDFQ